MQLLFVFAKKVSWYQFVLRLARSFAVMPGELSVRRHQYCAPVPCLEHRGPFANVAIRIVPQVATGKEERSAAQLPLKRNERYVVVPRRERTN